MALTQETFLGASIRGFNATMGWNNQASTCTVDLVEDPTNGDSFAPPAVGTAVNFDYQGWHFGGLLQSYVRQYGQQGNPVYTVQIQDPRELLSGVQLILADYTGTTGGVPNLYNIYGYLEALYGFGGSQINEAGMPWYLIRNAFWSLQLTTPIYFRGAYFILDPFIGLDLLPNYYRVHGDSVSALEFIEDICNATASDFAVEMIPYDRSDETPATNLIRVRRISRNITPTNNAINKFITQTEGAVAKQSGYELSNEVTSRFVVGGKVNNMYFQDRTTFGTVSQYDDTVLPFWGYDCYDRLIIGTGDFEGDTGKEYQFMLDGRPLYVLTGNGSLIHYYTDLAEMHAARGGQDSWEAFLAFHNYDRNSIHYGKAQSIGIKDGGLNPELLTWLSEAKAGRRPLPKRAAIHSSDTTPEALEAANVINEETKKRIAKVYNWVKTYATEYYGRKFMVRVPFVAGAYVPETTNIKLSMLPTKSGYVPEEYWGVAIYYGYMPYNPEKFTESDNKISPYAAFANMTSFSATDMRSQYAYDKLSPESYILDQYPNSKLGKMRENLYVKGTVEDKLVFVNPYTLFSPRAVITLDGPIADNVRNIELHSLGLLNELKIWLAEAPTTLSASEIEEWANEFGSISGGDINWKRKEANYRIPSMCAIPLESQVLRYGPWYIANTPGRVEFENDSSLVPWEFGSFTAMNNAGWAKVTSALTSQQSHEQGQVEYPGVPTLSLGSALINGGPYITDVNVQVGENGVTTTYRMQTWNWQFGRLGKYNVERFTRLSKVAMKQRKAFRRFYGYAQPLSITSMPGDREMDKDEPSIQMITGEVRTEGEDENKEVRPSVAGQTGKTMKKSVGGASYASKAGISMDGLFVPYTTKTDSDSDLPKFEEPSEDAAEPNVSNLNPFGGDSISSVFRENGDVVPRDGLTVDDNSEVKSIAFRAPIILAGWGFTTGGLPTPSGITAETAEDFHPNYKKRADKWKVGPLDVRWDDNKKTWNAAGGGGAGVYLGVVQENIPYAGSGRVNLLIYNASVGDEDTKPFSYSESVVAHEYVLSVGDVLYNGTSVIVTKSEDVYVIVGTVNTCGS